MFSSIKFEITMNLKVFHLHFDFDCKIDVQVNNQNQEMNWDELTTESQFN
jgi:hypothetical protein